MSDIQVGDYVRDRDGIIIKVNNIVLDEDSEDIWYEEKLLQGTWKSMITKHSQNLIDLIEVGDYVNGKIVKAINEWNSSKEGYFRYLVTEYHEIVRGDEIKSIVTHQQFNSVMYKVKE